jgi:uncharacterized protein
MSGLPEFPEQEPLPAESWPPQTQDSEAIESIPAEVEQSSVEIEPASAEPPLFASWSQHEPPPAARIPNLAHFGVFAVLVGAGSVVSGLLALLAMHYHLFGVSTVDELAKNIPLGLGVQAIWYLMTLALCAVIFPRYWGENLFAGLQWNGWTALRLRWKLIFAACGCFVLAMVDGVLLPTQGDAPIDLIFKAPGGAWVLFGFGVTFAPFFEELAFRGFLLPALCTTCDWISEYDGRQLRLPVDDSGHPQWSRLAMIAGSIGASLPFAAMHAAQQGYALGPFLLLVCVSLVLCWVRLSTRSLAASTLVHASYNFILFSISFVATDGFRHLDKM